MTFDEVLAQVRELLEREERVPYRALKLRFNAEIYGWFTEGFDTKDLQEAKALLEELSH